MSRNYDSVISLINVYVPPLLEHALGCTGKGRYIAYWVHPADGLCWTDGTHAGTCDGMDVWLDYLEDPRVHEFLAPFSFGSRHAAAAHWLVLDRKQRCLRVGGVESAARFMRSRRAPTSLPGRAHRQRYTR